MKIFVVRGPLEVPIFLEGGGRLAVIVTAAGRCEGLVNRKS